MGEFSIDGKNFIPISVPIVSKEVLLQPHEAVIHAMENDDPASAISLPAEYAARGYARVQEMVEGAGDSNAPAYGNLITPANIPGVLASNVQLRAILQAQGEQQARAFARFFPTGSNLPFARLWRLLVDISLRWMLTTVEYEDELRRTLAASFKFMTIGTWALLGSQIKEGDLASDLASSGYG